MTLHISVKQALLIYLKSEPNLLGTGLKIILSIQSETFNNESFTKDKHNVNIIVSNKHTYAS